MKPYEIVKAAIYNKFPERIPNKFRCFGCSDFAQVPIKRSSSFVPEFEGEDEWGCIWEKTEMANMGQVKGHPIKSIDTLNKVKFPDYDDDCRYTDVQSALKQYEREGKYVEACIFMVLFERMHSLYGFQNVLTDLYLYRPAMECLADFIVEKQISFVENLYHRFGNAIHGIHMSDDWGTQQAAFVSFDFWMDFFFPRYKKLFDTMHNCGYDVFVHSCGKVNEIIEGYIGAGVNVINLLQPRALGISEIGDLYRGRICFESIADIQCTLPTGNRSAIDKDIELLANHWISPKGGFIFTDYGNNHAIGIDDPDIKLYMYQKVSEVSKAIYGNPLPEVIV